MMLGRAVAWCCMIPLVLGPNPLLKPKADIIFLDGDVWAGVLGEASPQNPERAQAIAVKDGRIAALGADREVVALEGPDTVVVDLGGHFVMPGFNDAHLHLAAAGFERLNLDLVGVQSREEFRARLRARVATAAPGEWILGGGWDQTLWSVKELPGRLDLDEVTADHPVLLDRVDGHIAVANTRALQLAGITSATKDPAGGKIDRDLRGQPTGILRETARQAVTDIIPKLSRDRRKRALQAALSELAAAGVTSAQDYSTWDDFQALEELEGEGKLSARISEWLSFDDPVDVLIAHRGSHPGSDLWLHTGMLKGFMDGSLGSHTAALLAPYADEPENSGLPRYDQGRLNQMTRNRMAAGFQIGFHAIGDKAVQMALDAFAGGLEEARARKVKAPDGGEDFRLRIEHAQVTTPAEVERFRLLNVIASMQPNHLLTDLNWAEARLGPKRAAHSYAWAEFLRDGVPLAFGTDYPVEPVTPFRGLYAAVTRKSEDRTKEYFPEMKLNIRQAIAAYTTGAAFAEFAENHKGKLVPGMLADFVVLDQDITAVTPAKLLTTRVLRTVVGGKTVYPTDLSGEDPEWPAPRHPHGAF
jgi:predicted amidohydrolase YtcJ